MKRQNWILILLFLQPNAHAANLFDFKVVNNLPLFKKTEDAENLKVVAVQSLKYFTADADKLVIQPPWQELPKTYFNKKHSFYEKEYIFPSTQLISLNILNYKTGDKCHWSIDGKELDNNSCNDVHVAIPYTVKKPTYYEAQAVVKLIINNSDSTTSDSQTITTRDYIIAGLGDSYSSGEGNPDIQRQGFKKAQWFFGSDRCNRSLLSWPSLSAARLAVEDTKNSYRFISRACSGALIEDVGTESNFDLNPKGIKNHISNGWGRERTDVSQVTLLSNDLSNSDSKREPSLILLSAGGNDAGFGPFIVKAATRGRYIVTKSGKDLKSSIKSKLAQDKKFISAALPSMANNITEAFPNAKIIQAIYPDPLHRDIYNYCIGSKVIKGEKTRPFANKYWLLKVFHTLNIPFLEIPNNIQNPIYSDFLVPLTGSTSDHPYDSSNIGMRQWSNQISKTHPNWNVMVTRKNHDAGGDPPYDTYFVHGYCVPSTGYAGAWINNYDDSMNKQGINQGTLMSSTGVVHPNLYGQLYIVYRAFTDFNLHKLIQ